MLNKKRIILVVTILIISIIAFSNTCFAVTGKVTGKTVRIREKAKSESEIITNAYRNDYVEVIEKSGDWYKVKYEGKTGYMHKDYISVDDSDLADTNPKEDTSNNNDENQATNEKENTETENNQSNDENVSVYENNKLEKIENQEINLDTDVEIKLLPNYTSKTLGSINSGTTVTVKSQLNYWAYVTSNRISGWINIKNIVQKVENIQLPDNQEPSVTDENNVEPDTTTSTSENKTGKINVEKANVREKPTTSSDIIAGLKENDEVTIIAEEGSWYKIKTSKIKEGYISKKLVTLATVSSRGGNIQREEQPAPEIEEEIIEIEQEEIIEIPVETPVETPSVENVPSSDVGEEVAEYALQFIGCKYVYAGKNPDTGFDCSGFTQYVFANFGVSISASSKAQINYGEEVSEENLEPGDLLIFYNDAKTQIGHVGIYIGNDQFVHAANPKRGVVTDSIYNSYYKPRLIAIRRLV